MKLLSLEDLRQQEQKELCEEVIKGIDLGLVVLVEGADPEEGTRVILVVRKEDYIKALDPKEET